ncbi:cbb3-type cytochrome c oxidase subunit 3 [Synechococcus sp. Cruz CV-v-12]|uniref:cbb3-type cytochrome oxidase subunit 3 n=1 Tax=Synechococcus sp. Cruz CV-v-12 TaxID=2823728 RepID=UPI0020CD5D4A|nr:cbb3-type cytochrome c oxidase subunit 3 [Synechococcus sp. Cruz CV-v-12]MCP9874707.1 cbb3-type cytochrome c oxidase subunit 3 [Synechococcus sp. Cruz CV-v-12]
MRISDLIGMVDIAVYPQVALVIFLGVFAAIAVRAYSRAAKSEFDRAASLPLEDDSAAAEPTGPNGSKP